MLLFPRVFQCVGKFVCMRNRTCSTQRAADERGLLCLNYSLLPEFTRLGKHLNMAPGVAWHRQGITSTFIPFLWLSSSHLPTHRSQLYLWLEPSNSSGLKQIHVGKVWLLRLCLCKKVKLQIGSQAHTLFSLAGRMARARRVQFVPSVDSRCLC